MLKLNSNSMHCIWNTLFNMIKRRKLLSKHIRARTACTSCQLAGLELFFAPIISLVEKHILFEGAIRWPDSLFNRMVWNIFSICPQCLIHWQKSSTNRLHLLMQVLAVLPFQQTPCITPILSSGCEGEKLSKALIVENTNQDLDFQMKWGFLVVIIYFPFT